MLFGVWCYNCIVLLVLGGLCGLICCGLWYCGLVLAGVCCVGLFPGFC